VVQVVTVVTILIYHDCFCHYLRAEVVTEPEVVTKWRGRRSNVAAVFTPR
jgi:hypothetical protein